MKTLTISPGHLDGTHVYEFDKESDLQIRKLARQKNGKVAPPLTTVVLSSDDEAAPYYNRGRRGQLGYEPPVIRVGKSWLAKNGYQLERA